MSLNNEKPLMIDQCPDIDLSDIRAFDWSKNFDKGRTKLILKKLKFEPASFHPSAWDKLSGDLCTPIELSERFMRKFADKLNWDKLVTFQNMSDEFRIEMQLKGYI